MRVIQKLWRQLTRELKKNNKREKKNNKRQKTLKEVSKMNYKTRLIKNYIEKGQKKKDNFWKNMKQRQKRKEHKKIKKIKKLKKLKKLRKLKL